jgi:hypothetical protein
MLLSQIGSQHLGGIASLVAGNIYAVKSPIVASLPACLYDISDIYNQRSSDKVMSI